MSKFEGNKTVYCITRETNIDYLGEQAFAMDATAGSIYWNDSLEGAMRFESLEKAKSMAETQNTISRLMDQPATFRIVKLDNSTEVIATIGEV